VLEVRPLDLSPSGIERTCKLLNVVYPHARHITPAYLDRLYNGNPLGRTSGYSGFDEHGDLVAHYLVIPIKTRIFGTDELGIWPFQLATHPGYRGKGLFTRMTEQSFDAAREAGYSYISGITNAMSTPLWVGKWGCQNICSLDVKIGVGPTPPRREGTELDFVRVWDAPGLEWRLGIAEHGYRVASRDGRGHLYAPTGRFGIWVEVGNYAKELLPRDLAPYRGPQPLRLWIGRDPSRDWSGSLYFDVPERLKPSPLNLLWYDLTGQGRTFDPARVRYDVFDFDGY